MNKIIGWLALLLPAVLVSVLLPPLPHAEDKVSTQRWDRPRDATMLSLSIEDSESPS